MMHIDSTKAKTKFGEMLDFARREPIAIDKRGRMVAVLLSNEEYEKMQEIEDQYWGLKAQIARKEGLLSETESEKILEDLLDA